NSPVTRCTRGPSTSPTTWTCASASGWTRSSPTARARCSTSSVAEPAQPSPPAHPVHRTARCPSRYVTEGPGCRAPLDRAHASGASSRLGHTEEIQPHDDGECSGAFGACSLVSSASPHRDRPVSGSGQWGIHTVAWGKGGLGGGVGGGTGGARVVVHGRSPRPCGRGGSEAPHACAAARGRGRG